MTSKRRSHIPFRSLNSHLGFQFESSHVGPEADGSEKAVEGISEEYFSRGGLCAGNWTRLVGEFRFGDWLVVLRFSSFYRNP